MQVVKTEVVPLRQNEEFKLLERYEYTAHSNPIQTEAVPVVRFHYELSPMQVSVIVVFDGIARAVSFGRMKVEFDRRLMN